MAFCLLPSAQALGLVVEFKQSAVVDGVSVTLGDIADFNEDSDLSRALASQKVAQAPTPGNDIQLKARIIIGHLNPQIPSTDHVEWRGSAVIVVGRNVIQVGTNQILDIIDTYLQERKEDLPDAEIRFIPSAKPLPFVVPAGDLSWEVIPSNPGIVRSSRFSVIFRVDGRVRKNMSVKGRLEMLAPVVVATSTLPKGTILTTENVSTSVLDLNTLRSPCQNLQQVIGKRIKRSIKAGNIVSLSYVEFPPVVRKGELVRMIVDSGGLFLTATGIARNDGILNQTIRVQNLNSHKIIYCRVTAPGVVEVAL